MGISAREAAELAGVSKGAILRSIKTGRMSAQKDVRGEWEIDPAELSRVYTIAHPNERGDTPEYTLNAPREMALMREMLSRQDEVINDLRRRLDAESEKTQRLTLLLEVSPPQPKSWWRRLTGG